MTHIALETWLTEQGFPAGQINAVARNLHTPLMTASHQGNAAIVAGLIQAGTDIQARNADGNNALWLGCVASNLEVIGLLIAAGIDIDNQNDNGATCLMYAASTGKSPIVARLLEAGARPELQTLDGFTALDMASTLECLQMLRRPR
jgi:ankyrin repeat protein